MCESADEDVNPTDESTVKIPPIRNDADVVSIALSGRRLHVSGEWYRPRIAPSSETHLGDIR